MLTTIFILSGVALATLLVAKRIEEKKKRPVFILNLISRGDTHMRELHHRAVQYYSLGKEKGVFLVQKQLPRYSRSSLNKALALLEDRVKKHFDSIRDSRLLKKSDGISEFFKNISEVERGGGELHDDVYDEETQEITTPVRTPKEPVIEVSFEVVESRPMNIEPVTEGTSVETTETISTEVTTPKIKTSRTPRKSPAKRRLKVVSGEPTQFI
jgi:hypothetical protein